MKHTADQKVAYWVRRYRKERKMTQAVLADRIGISRTSIPNWEAGRIPISVEWLEAIAHVLYVDITLFF